MNQPLTSFVLLGFCALCMGGFRLQAQVRELSEVTFSGQILEEKDLSAAAFLGGRLLIGSDEKSAIQILQPTSASGFRVESTIQLYGDPEVEADIEAITISGNRIYATGSHGLVRKKVEYPADPDDRKYERNRERLTEVTNEPARNRIFRFSISAEGTRQSRIDVINLRTILANDVVLAPFLSIPGKEGGVDVEGMAADGDLLYLGFRGPVLRQNFVPVLKLDFDRPSAYERIYVNLGGHGIRDMLKVSGGFLLLAGPVGDADHPCELYFWDGSDCVPGRGRTPAIIRNFGKVPAPDKGKAEAIALLEETSSHWNLLALYDGVANGGAKRLQVARP